MKKKTNLIFTGVLLVSESDDNFPPIWDNNWQTFSGFPLLLRLTLTELAAVDEHSACLNEHKSDDVKPSLSVTITDASLLICDDGALKNQCIENWHLKTKKECSAVIPKKLNNVYLNYKESLLIDNLLSTTISRFTVLGSVRCRRRLFSVLVLSLISDDETLISNGCKDVPCSFQSDCGYKHKILFHEEFQPIQVQTEK